MTTDNVTNSNDLYQPRIPLSSWLIYGSLFTLLLLYHCSLYYPFIADDALISLRYAERLLQGDGLTWTSGEAVEGYSNLAWVLGVSMIGAFGLNLIDAARVLGVTSILFSFWALARAYPRSDQKQSILPWIGGALILCASPPIAVWTIGGLEQSLFLATLLWYLVGGLHLLDEPNTTTKATIVASALAGALLCITRPDGPLFIMLWASVFAIKTYLTERPRLSVNLRRGAPLLVFPLIAVVTQTLFRVIYYGDWLPNTAHLKAEISDQTLTWGQAYWYDAALIVGPFFLPAFLSLKSSKKASISLVWLSVITWVGYTWGVGGDIFPGHRHAVIICGLLALLTTLGIMSISSVLIRRLSLLLTIGICALSFKTSQSAIAYQNAKIERWEWDGKIIGEWIGAAFRQNDPLIAVTAAGTLPYFSKLRALDMQGLNDRHIARQPAQSNYMLGHNRGDGAYVLSRKPDLLAFRVFGLGPPAFVSGDQMKKSREFIMRYRLRGFEGQAPHYVKSQMYVRLDGAVGVDKQNANEVFLPGYLFRDMVAQPSPNLDHPPLEGIQVDPLRAPSQTQPAQQMVVKWPIEEMVHLTNFPLSPGRWSVELDPPLPIRIQNFTKRGKQSADIGIQVLHSHEALTAPAPTTYKRHNEVLVRGVRLKRIGEADSPQFIVSKEGLERAREVEQQAIQKPIMMTLDNFETKVGSSKSLWTDQWVEESQSDIHRNLTHITQGGVPHQNQVRQFGGSALVNTYHKRIGDQALMKAWSPRLTLPAHSILSFKVGGGAIQRKVGVRLWIDDIAVGTWAGRDTESLSQFHIDLRIFAGRTLQVELLDQSQTGWGHLLFDDLWLSNHILSARERATFERAQPQSESP